MAVFKGVAASPGIAIGEAYVIQEKEIEISTEKIPEEKIQREIETFRRAISASKEQIDKIRQKTLEEMGEEKAQIFQAHMMILEDPSLVEAVEKKIKEEYITAENALYQVTEEYVNIFMQMEDEYLRERASDIKDVSARVMKNILGIQANTLADMDREVVIVAKDLTPSETAQIDKKKVLAFAADVGGRTSHMAIMARSLEKPAVLGLSKITANVKTGDRIIVDGNEGVVIVNPDEQVYEEYLNLKQKYMEYKEELKRLKEMAGITTDGCRVELSANIGTPEDVCGALQNGAEGIGLYRTEFLYMHRDEVPSEEEQFKAYREVAEKMQGKPVIIRTLDIGGDKKLPYLDMPEELNPFLGWRAIRMCLDRPEILKTQLKAILRASGYGSFKIMYPMVSSVEEIRKANGILEEAKEELRREGVSFDNKLQVGIMVEIPSAAVTADLLAKEVDFFSIGTNDLVQYTLAVDRMNAKLSHMYDPFHPAVLRLIKNVIDSSHDNGKWTGMCGEMAGDPLAAPILVGMGIDELSMSAASIPQVKRIIRSLSLEEAKGIVEKVFKMESSQEIRNYLKDVVGSILKRN
uniref:phosphoenolpyruvate--protein phosphotransferase n=1 Tax=Desulforadius tongensis TaxID=1216062 RepID=UPI00195CCFA0|nr:phosphoenolpyruvate--protein phosphotransferase [Desulforadius tongensis]